MPVNTSMNPMAAASLYANNAKNASPAGASEAPAATGASFGDMMETAAKAAIETVREGEKMSAAAITGKANITDVVQAVSQAKLTLETVTAVRDNMVDAYQRIMQMPI